MDEGKSHRRIPQQLRISQSYRESVDQLGRLLEPVIAESRKLPAAKFGFNEDEPTAGGEDDDSYRREAKALADRLLSNALAEGVPEMSNTVELAELSGGAASDFVFRARMQMSFVIKVQRDAKLRKEALWLLARHPETQDATPWGALFPRVLSTHLDSPPYAYVMEDFRTEDGYRDLAAWIFDGQLLPTAREAQVHDLLDYVLQTLSNVYQSSKNVNSRPTLGGDAYLKRIENRMAEAENLFAGFAAPVLVDGASHSSWRVYVAYIKNHQADAEAVFPSFETAVHGDLHPGNIIIRLRRADTTRNYEPELRLIDPRGWESGDYVFDLAKLSHYLELTGPIERLGVGGDVEFDYINGNLEIKKFPEIPTWVRSLGAKVMAKAGSLGEAMGDEKACRRYPLAMASCLLGTVPLRWGNGQHDLAVMMYADGLRWLSAFCNELKGRVDSR